jgi:hypothetical protein
LNLKNDSVLASSIEVISKLRDDKEWDNEMIKYINQTLAFILTQYPKLSSNYNEILEQVLVSIIEDKDSLNRHDYYKKYLKLLYKSEQFIKLMFEAIKMHNIFNQDIYPLGNLD